eukprot:CAMPEP_0198574584 /NCGR_PEP_ID=MMETSP1462-20131121/114881_1 /TAXON_ID=1333877 /ORGANISM="Brandtodinium nutriculum, Strain RCC3387" /LENGTH=84 /DNA_ID=CAMNT_0044305805 /DNA_START=1 /DNA_END=251 /DNA_ORIENTATION=-
MHPVLVPGPCPMAPGAAMCGPAGPAFQAAAQRQASANAAFDALDRNRDGVITRAELAEASPGANFDALDQNRDGVITRDEMLQA